jgi:hypothetical protein
MDRVFSQFSAILRFGRRHSRHVVIASLALLGVVAAASRAEARQDGWTVAVYPILGWVPLGINFNVDVPPFDGGDGSGGDRDILDGRFDGAFLGGVSASAGNIRIDVDGMWAAVGADRLELPRLILDADVIYAHGMFGVRVAPDTYVGFGVRRFALDYTIKINDQPDFNRTPGVWDPLLGVGWHRVGPRVEYHAIFEAGGFGVGSDVDLGTSFRVDWKPLRVFGLTAGYNFLYFKVTDEISTGREFKVTQTLHGPILGIGFYF